MNKIVLLIMIIGLSSTYAQNKINYKLIAEYSYTKQIDSLDIKSKTKLENYSLFINDNSSLFISNNRINLDTLLYDVNFSDMGKLMLLPKPSSNRRILKQAYSENIIVYDEFYDRIYKYNDTIGLKWEISNSYDSISDFKVRKAETKFRGRKYVAWYTDEIPISDGPYKFKGLPGLIVKIYDSKKEFIFLLEKLTQFKNNKSLIFDYDNDVLSVTKHQYKTAKKNFKSNPIPYMESEGAVFSEETKRIIKEKFRTRNKKTNNPIELKGKDE